MLYKSLSTFVDVSAPLSAIKSLTEFTNQTGIHLTVNVIATAPPIPIYDYGVGFHGALMLPETWQGDIEANAKELDQKADTIKDLLKQTGALGEVAKSYCQKSLIEKKVGQLACVTDLALVNRSLFADIETLHSTISGVLFNSPIGMVLCDDFKSPAVAAKTVFVAWNSGLPAARAVHLALPILKQADHVIIGIFDPKASEHLDGEEPGNDVATWLSRHDCKVSVNQYPSGGKEIGDLILRRSKEAGADLIVMGAYGRSKMMQWIFGGTTTTIIDSSNTPVLLAH